MTGPVKTADEVLAFIGRIDEQAIRWEEKKLRGIRAWAMARLGVDYTVGDCVEIVMKVVDKQRSPGWWHYREALAPGATGTVEKIDFSPGFGDRPGRWYADVMLDREWSVHDGFGGAGPRRYWNGPADETPEGMEPPSPYNQQAYPDGTRHTFMLRVEHLRKHAEPPTPEPCDACGHMPDKAEE